MWCNARRIFASCQRMNDSFDAIWMCATQNVVTLRQQVLHHLANNALLLRVKHLPELREELDVDFIRKRHVLLNQIFDGRQQI